jgi:hypothetical protein
MLNSEIKTPAYAPELLQVERPQPMYDKTVHRTYKKIFFTNPADDAELLPRFKSEFITWLKADRLNRWRGFEDGFVLDACIGCTQFIDDLYQTVGRERLQIFSGDYKYHWRLNPELQAVTLESLRAGAELLIAMPFPRFGDKHPQMDEILARCLELKIPVHIDAAWLGCVRDVEFDFSHPAIVSFAVSLSKALGLGGNRIGLRFTRRRENGPITIMNDFAMNCQSLLHIGREFMRELPINYFWNKYGDAYAQVCRDFSLRPTRAIHLALRGDQPVGVRPLLRHLSDR